MLHCPALPGSPASSAGLPEILDTVLGEAEIYRQAGVDGLILENMHDTPYCRDQDLGPEVTACMTAVAGRVRAATPPSLPVGVQVLAAANRSALAVALAAGLQFIRAEGFVFSHVADEGWIDGQAGPLLRYRRNIGATQVAVLADIKKKHSAHAVTADVSLADTARAAKFFRADGVVVTGAGTGLPACPAELASTLAAVPGLPVLVGSGVTAENIEHFSAATALIIGTEFKQGGRWENALAPDRILAVVERARQLQGELNGWPENWNTNLL